MTLYLSNNGIGAEGVARLAEALRKNTVQNITFYSYYVFMSIF